MCDLGGVRSAGDGGEDGAKSDDHAAAENVPRTLGTGESEGHGAGDEDEVAAGHGLAAAEAVGDDGGGDEAGEGADGLGRDDEAELGGGGGAERDPEQRVREQAGDERAVVAWSQQRGRKKRGEVEVGGGKAEGGVEAE